jgi:predicted ArsR family transcriptional regulator
MSRWHARLLESTRGRVLALLRTKNQTVKELADQLSITSNAVRAHLVSLERDGLVRRTGTKTGLRRPHVSYGLSEEADQMFPTLYGPIFSNFLAIARKQLGPRAFRISMRELGRRIASTHSAKVKGQNRIQRLKIALVVLKELGGAPKICRSKDKVLIRSNRCPLASVTVEHPEACLVAESLLHEIIGAPVEERCLRGPNPRCRFQIS